MIDRLVKPKVLAYITHLGRLLVFWQPAHPDAGLQIPGGTIEPGEDPAVAVMREAREETGLEQLRLVRYLGRCLSDQSIVGKDELHDRHYFHLAYTGPRRERWTHIERHPSEGDADQIVFEFWWASLDDDPISLIGGQDEMLIELRRPSRLDRGE